ncbi:MAG TPA: carboxyl transferase domain-containing protein [Acidimicrobiia bacterium]|jgi:acetyl-CoA carboxylase carboxyltransferase component|nr:carboxyl transferase domain-containing protein [Acidimicrobiia bacterium]
MTWQPELDDLADRRAAAAELGGDERVARHHAAGKLTVRQRIDGLVDPGSFAEIGSVAGFAQYSEDGRRTAFTPANFVLGDAAIDGRPVVVAGDDFTVRGGAADASIWEKLVHAEQRARRLRVPIVRLVDGSGGGGSVKSYHDLGRTYVPPLPGWRDQMEMLSEVPVVAAALGSVAGLGAARVAGSHLAVMVDGTSQVFVAGPPIVAYATHEDLEKEDLGGAGIHGRNGTVDLVVESEAEAFAAARRFLSFLPRSVWEMPPVIEAGDDPNRSEEALLDAIPRNRRQIYDGRRIIEMVVDHDSFFEIGARWGRALVTGFARLDGHPIGVLGADPRIAGGVLSADGAQKLRRFVDLCDTFHLPVVNFVDQPGFAVGSKAEQASTIRHGAAAIAALYQMRIPYFVVILRRTFGVAGAAMVDAGEPHLRVAWPSGDWGSLPLEGGIEAAFKRRLAEADEPDSLRNELLAGFEAVRSPFRTAEAFDIEEIIDPRATRPILCRWVNTVWATLAHDLGPKGRGYRP